MKKWLFLFLFLPLGLIASCDLDPVHIPQPSPEAVSFYQSGNVLWLINQIWGLIVPAALFFTGFAALLRAWCQRLAKHWIPTLFLFTFLLVLILTALNFPLDFYGGYIRPHAYGLSTQSFGRWLSHFFINLGVTTVLSLLVTWAVFAIIRKSPKRWWLYLGLLTIPFALFMQVVQPIWIDPLFNKFEPMKDKALEAKILHLAERAGIEGSRVYEVDKSADTKKMNAYVVGIWDTKRIVIWDTTIKGLTENELLFVMGHEMGHYVLHHVWYGIGVYSIISIITLFFTYWIGGFFLRTSHRCSRVREFSDVASLPLVLLFYSFFSLLFAPAWNLYSQWKEHEADTFGLEITQDNRAAAEGFIKLMSTNLGYPWPGKGYMLFRTGHPSIGERITFFNTYHPWCEGKPLKYGDYFKRDHAKIAPSHSNN